MNKMSYAEKPRLQLMKRNNMYCVQYIDSSRHVWRGLGPTWMSAYYALEKLVNGHVRSEHKVQIQRDKLRPDIGLGPSDHHIATPNLPWWRRLFRI